MINIEVGKVYKSSGGRRLRVTGFYRHELNGEAGVLFREVSLIHSGPHQTAVSLHWWSEQGFKLMDPQPETSAQLAAAGEG